MQFLLFIMLAALGGCASQPAAVDTFQESDAISVKQVEKEARGLFFQAERSFKEKDFVTARRLFLQLKTKHPKGKAAMIASYRLGSLYYYQEEYFNASREFEAFLKKYPRSSLAFDAAYNLSASEFQQKNYARAYDILSKMKSSDIREQGPRRAEVVYQLKYQTALALRQSPMAVLALAEQMQLPLSEEKREQVAERVDETLEGINNPADLERILQDVSEPVTRHKTSQRLAALRTGAPATGFTTDGYNIPEAQLGSASRGRRNHVGIILPLSGKDAKYGRSALDGILLAAGSFASNGPNFRIFIEDTRSSPAVARQAVDSLFHKHEVMAIIGPLHFKEAQAVGERAQQLGILNLSLTGREGISERGAYLFQNALTPSVQLESLVEFATRERGFRRFGILAPDNNFGRDMSNQFWDLVEANKATVVAHEFFDAKAKDFQIYIKKIFGLDNLKHRGLEVRQLNAFLDEAKEKTGRRPRISLPPVEDFDALFIPDSPAKVAQIAATLAYFGVKNVKLLGTTEWNSPQLYKRGGKYVLGALFPGGVSRKGNTPLQKQFIRHFYAAYGKRPDLLASQAYEAMGLVTEGIRRSSNNRNELVRELVSLRDFESPLGTITFGNTRIARRKMPIFMLQSGGKIIKQQ